jgi:hypothetical protein
MLANVLLPLTTAIDLTMHRDIAITPLNHSTPLIGLVDPVDLSMLRLQSPTAESMITHANEIFPMNLQAITNLVANPLHDLIQLLMKLHLLHLQQAQDPVILDQTRAFIAKVQLPSPHRALTPRSPFGIAKAGILRPAIRNGGPSHHDIQVSLYCS